MGDRDEAGRGDILPPGGNQSTWKTRHSIWLAVIFLFGAGARSAMIRAEADDEEAKNGAVSASEPSAPPSLDASVGSSTPVVSTPEAVPRAEEKIARITSSKGSAVGWIVSPKGHVLTRILPTTQVGSSVTIELSDGSVFDGRVERISDTHDLSVVSCEGCADRGFLQVARASLVRTGTVVYAFGSPAARSNLTKGKVVHPNRKVDETVFTECDIPFGPTDSGGPLLDPDGRVVGILAANVGRLGGICFALPIEYATEGPAAILSGIIGRATPFSAEMLAQIERAVPIQVSAPKADKEVSIELVRAQVEIDRRAQSIMLNLEWSLEIPTKRPYAGSDRFSLIIASADGRTTVQDLGHVEPSRVVRDEATSKVSYRFAKAAPLDGRGLYRATVAIGFGAASSTEVDLGQAYPY